MSLYQKSWKHLNRKFRELMFENPFDFYYGPFANIIRTKYRKVDMPLTRNGVRKIRKKGIHALVHGHRNLSHGQRLMLTKRTAQYRMRHNAKPELAQKRWYAGPRCSSDHHSP